MVCRQLSDWRLAAFELDQIDHDLTQAAAMLSSNSPLRNSLSKPLGVLRKAIDSKHTLEFADAYAALTNECNACHRATGHGFITVQVPASSSFPDQAFEDLVAEGRGLTQRICGTCHALPDTSMPMASRFGAPGFEDLVRRPSFTEGRLRELLMSNHRRLGPNQAMPNPRLTDYQVDEIIAFVGELRTTLKIP